VPVGVEALEVDITAFMTSGQEAATPPVPLCGAPEEQKGSARVRGSGVERPFPHLVG
jgi:hypothetical protein